MEVFQAIKDAAAQIIAGKGATNYAIGLRNSAQTIHATVRALGF